MDDIIKILLEAEIDDGSIGKIQNQIDKVQKNAKPIKIEVNTKGAVDSMSQMSRALTDAAKMERDYTKAIQMRLNEHHTAALKTNRNINREHNQEIKDAIKLEKDHAKAIQMRLKEHHSAALAINKSIESEKKKSEVLKEQIELFKRRQAMRIDRIEQKHDGGYDVEALEKYKQQLNELGVASKKPKSQMKDMAMGISEVESAARLSGSSVESFSSKMLGMTKQVAAFAGISLSIAGVARAVKGGVQSVTSLDTSLTELNKVANLSTNELSQFTDEAYAAGKEIGRTGQEVIDATAEFKRAGYTIGESFGLSDDSLLLTNVGDGINNVEEATSSLIAILKGFKMEATESSHAVDALNEVSNNYAVDAKNLTDVLERTAGTVAQTGTSYEELLGLSVGGYETLRNAEMTASGINMITMRLKGMEESGEKVEGLIPKIQGAFDEYTKGAVQIIDEQNGGLNSTYDILQQLSEVYPTLTDEAKAYLNEAVAGNRKQNGGFVQKCA